MVSALSNLCCHLLFICHHGSGSLGWTRHAATISAAESSHNAFSQKDAGNMKEATFRKNVEEKNIGRHQNPQEVVSRNEGVNPP